MTLSGADCDKCKGPCQCVTTSQPSEDAFDWNFDLETAPCTKCSKYFFMYEMEDKEFCEKCFQSSAWGKAESLSPIAQRFTCYGQVDWLSKPGLRTLEKFLANWLINFDSTLDKNTLLMLFHGQIVPQGPGRHPIRMSDLELALLKSNLPRSQTETSKLAVIHEWMTEYGSTSRKFQSTRLEPDDLELFVANRNRRAIWGLDGAELLPLRLVKVFSSITRQKIAEELRLTGALTNGSDDYPELRALNSMRDFLLRGCQSTS